MVKKGGATEDEDLEKRNEFAGVLQSCLDAPCPVRHLKETDRLRELVRGLVSKKKERALERDKAKAKSIAQGEKKAGSSGRLFMKL